MGADEALELRVHLRSGHPAVYIPSDPLAWFWLSPITIESLAPLLMRPYGHTAAVLARPELGETEATRRN